MAEEHPPGNGNGTIYAILIVVVILLLSAVLYVSKQLGGEADDGIVIEQDVVSVPAKGN